MRRNQVVGLEEAFILRLSIGRRVFPFDPDSDINPLTFRPGYH